MHTQTHLHSFNLSVSLSLCNLVGATNVFEKQEELQGRVCEQSVSTGICMSQLP